MQKCAKFASADILRPGNLMLFATLETWRELNRVNFHKEFWYCYCMGQVKQIGQ